MVAIDSGQSRGALLNTCDTTPSSPPWSVPVAGSPPHGSRDPWVLSRRVVGETFIIHKTVKLPNSTRKGDLPRFSLRTNKDCHGFREDGKDRLNSPVPGVLLGILLPTPTRVEEWTHKPRMTYALYFGSRWTSRRTARKSKRKAGSSILPLKIFLVPGRNRR